MTLKKFFNTPHCYISCQTEEEAKILCNKFDELGLTWFSDESYAENTFWDCGYQEKSVYTAHFYGNLDNKLADNDYTVVDFNAVDDFYDDFNEKYINLKDFFDSYPTQMIAIKCNTLTEVEKLLKKFDELGHKWRSGERYTEPKYQNSDSYYCNDGGYYPRMTSEISNRAIPVYKFEDVVDFWSQVMQSKMKK